MPRLRFERRHLHRTLRRFAGSIWFYPTLLSACAVGLFVVTTWWDMRLQGDLSSSRLPQWTRLFVFSGSADSAQSLLETVAGMWAAIIGISFSVTLVTLQLTATKYVAQLLPLFERNRVNQVVLGSFLGTVIYALLVLRTVRTADPAFVPYLGVNVAMLLAILALFLLILFMSNVIGFIRPQHFLDRMAHDLRRCLRSDERLPRLEGIELLDSPVPEVDPSGSTVLAAPREGVLAEVAWDELCRQLRGFLEAGTPGVWTLHLTKRVGDHLYPDEPVAHLSVPDGGRDTERVLGWIECALDIRATRWQPDDADYSLEAIAGMTIKGAVQGDLDVTFEGVDHLFSIMPSLAKTPLPPAAFRLVAGEREFRIFRPVDDLLGKLLRELTLINEVALAPSLPFRPVTEGISDRLVAVLEGFAQEGAWEAFDRVLEHGAAWYQSAFHHLEWINGLERLASDLAKLALAVQACKRPPALRGVMHLVIDLQARHRPGTAAHTALADALQRLHKEGVPGVPPS